MISWQIIRQHHGFVQLHAAALEIDGQALILPGDPGSGKSTLAAGLVARGWSYLCDEFALIEPETPAVHPFPRALCIKEPSFPVVDGLGLPLRRKTPYRKPTKGRVAFLNPLEVRPDVEGRPAPVRWVIFPKYIPGAEPTLKLMSRSQAAFDLSRQCFNFCECEARALAVLALVARGADCYRLTAGDIHDTCDLLESLLLSGVARKAG
jgi:HprK-related kinase A